MKNGLGSIQSALVIGGDSDIAFAVCTKLANDRLQKLTLAGRNLEALNRRSDAIRSISDLMSVRCIELDVTEHDTHADIVETALFAGDIDLVLFAAGLLGDQAVDERDAGRATSVIQTNFTGAVSLLIPIANRLVEQGHGTIIVLSSVAAERPRRSNFIYGASKAGLDAFAQGLGDALHGSGVNVIVVRPGHATTKMTEGMSTPPLATDADTIAQAIVNAVRRGSEIVWVPAKLRPIMTVIKMLPRPIFRKLPI